MEKLAEPGWPPGQPLGTRFLSRHKIVHSGAGASRVSHYGHSPSRLAWQFYTELGNVHAGPKPADVVAWHAAMPDWLMATALAGRFLASVTQDEPAPATPAPSLAFALAAA
jgi:hypothetical protein